ncbi:MAG: hypothetical protein BHV93_04030 [Clostridiales bacterium 52_15]|nr:MAG: hypothetical protein BHV93_04030 [Clostridiales bacterium 52_15]
MAGISCQLVSSLNDFAKENSNPEFALIYDRDSVYAWGNNEIVLLAKNDFPIGIETRSYIEDVPTTYYSDIELAQLTPATKLNGGISCYSEDDESAYVRVPAVKQTTDSNCWAACMASILSVELGGNYTCDDLNSLLPSSSGATIPQVKNLFPTHFNINYSTFTASASDLSFNLLPVLNKLGEGHPLFGGFNSPAQAAGHAMVIRGINLGSNTYSAMDPATASYCSGTIRRATPNTGALLYAAPSAGLFSISPHTWVNFTAMKKSILVLLTISLISLAVLDASGSVEKTTAVEFVQYTTDGFIGREKYGLTHKEIEFTPKIGGSPVIANSGDVLMVTYCKVSYGALDGVTCEPIKITKNYLSHIAHLR